MEIVALDVEWWQDAQGNPVPFGDARGVSVLYGVGSRVSAEKATALKAMLSPPQDKAVKSHEVAKK